MSEGGRRPDSETVPPPGGAHANLAALARLAFGTAPGPELPSVARHLALLPPDALDLDVNDPAQRVLGDYEVIEKLGQGGMGVVYRARQRSLGRDVALKLLAAGPWASDDFIARFQREAQSAARLAHPNIVPIFEIGAQDSLNYFSMQLVRGQSLAQMRAESGVFDPRHAATLVRTIAEAVDYAHRLGLLHLDLKPANVLIDADGTPHVADFGLARPLDSSLGVDSDEVSGTPSYMAPEQAQVRSHRLSMATDIYGLGAILFELLTGRPPFVGANPNETLKRVLHEPPPSPRALRSTLPIDLDAITLRCLAKDPRERYSSARALADDLGRFLEGRPVSVRPLHAGQRLLRWARREPRLAALVGALLFSLGGGLAATSLQWQRADRNAESASASAAQARQTLWDARAGQAWRDAQRGDNYGSLRLLASNLVEQEAAADPAEAALERRRTGALETLAPRWIDHLQLDTGNAGSIALSGDAQRVAVSTHAPHDGQWRPELRWHRSDDLGSMTAVALTTATGAPASGVRQLRFSDDDRRLLATEDWGADKVTPPGIQMHLVDIASTSPVGWPTDFEQPHDATFADDGRHALLRNRIGQVQMWALDPWRPLGPRVAAPQSANWLFRPEVGVLAVAHSQMRRLELWSVPELEPLRSINWPGESRLNAWALAPGGRQLALGDEHGQLHLADLDTGAVSMLGVVSEHRIRALAYSADGGWLAAGSDGGSVRAWDLARKRALFAGLETGLRITSIRIDRASGLLIASTRDGLRVHRLTDLGTQPSMAVALADPLQPIDWFPAQPVAAHFASGQMASVDQGGLLRLWRLPRPPLLQARAAHQVESGFVFDGRHLVEVDDRRVRVIDAATQSGLSEWFEFIQRPGFATLSRDAQVLLVTAGQKLHGIDWRTRTPLGDPIDLSGSPTRLALAPDGSSAVFAVPAPTGDGYHENLSRVSLGDWRVSAGPVRIDGWIGAIDVAADGAHLRIARLDAAVDIVRASDLTSLPWVESTIDSWWAQFSADGRTLLAGGRRDGTPAQIRRWQLPGGEPTALAHAPPILPTVELPGGRGIVGIAESGRDVLTRLLLRPDGQVLPLPRPLIATGGQGEASSADGQLFAESRAYSIVVAETARGRFLAPTLFAGLTAPDRVMSLSMAADGSALLARSHRGRWLYFGLPGNDEPATTLLARARVLDRSARDALAAEDSALPARDALRSSDPGPWPSRAAAAELDPGRWPERVADTPAHALDLGAHYNFALDAIIASPNENHITAEYHALPPGTHRIGPTVYDIRGGIQFAPAVRDEPTNGAFASTSASGSIELPAGRHVAVHALLSAQTMGGARPLEEPIAYLELTWHYADDSEASAYIRHGEHLRWHHHGPRRDGRNAAWLMPRSVSSLDYGAGVLLHDVRIANPHPDRPTRAISLRVPASPGYAPHSALFALTLETAAKEPTP